MTAIEESTSYGLARVRGFGTHLRRHCGADLLKWSFPYFSTPNGGALSTSSGVVFAGDSDGNFMVLNAKTGRDLWHVQLGAAIYSTAVTFELGSKQCVVIPAGSALFAFALP